MRLCSFFNLTKNCQTMNKILSKQQFSEKVFCLTVETPLIARSCRPGQFIIVRVDKNSERVPYTIAKSDTEKRHSNTCRPGSRAFIDETLPLGCGRLCARHRRTTWQSVTNREIRNCSMRRWWYRYCCYSANTHSTEESR